MSQNHERPEMIDRIEGALFGVAVGDALGAPLEFLNASQILERHGKPVAEMVGGGWLSVLPGEVTDDTQMTLAVAEGILRAHETGADMVECVGGMFLRWYATRPRDVGQTCAMVLDALSGSVERTESAWHAAARNLFEELHGRTAGNGALMRTVYPALWFPDADEAASAAVRIGRMTHWHEASDHALEAYVRAIVSAVQGSESAREARMRASSILQGVKELAAAPVRPSGYCVESLKCALHALESTESFEQALVLAVNLGGDADTVGAITGGLAGAVYGKSAIPERWLARLGNRPNDRTAAIFCPGDGLNDPDGLFLRRLAHLARKAFERQRARP